MANRPTPYTRDTQERRPQPAFGYAIARFGSRSPWLSCEAFGHRDFAIRAYLAIFDEEIAQKWPESDRLTEDERKLWRRLRRENGVAVCRVRVEVADD